jgi:hypothetical protein
LMNLLPPTKKSKGRRVCVLGLQPLRGFRCLRRRPSLFDHPQPPSRGVRGGGFHPVLAGCHKGCNKCPSPAGRIRSPMFSGCREEGLFRCGRRWLCSPLSRSAGPLKHKRALCDICTLAASPQAPTSSRFYQIIFSRPPPLEIGKAVEKTISTANECQNVKPDTVPVPMLQKTWQVESSLTKHAIKIIGWKFLFNN